MLIHSTRAPCLFRCLILISNGSLRTLHTTGRQPTNTALQPSTWPVCEMENESFERLSKQETHRVRQTWQARRRKVRRPNSLESARQHYLSDCLAFAFADRQVQQRLMWRA